MNTSPTPRSTGSASGFTLIELMISSVAFSFVLGAISMGFISYKRTFSLAKDYAAARLTLSDYINLDLRRSTAFEPTFLPDQVHGNWKTKDWTLPVAMTVPDYYQSNKVTVNQPVRRTLTATEWDDKKADYLARGKLPPPNWTVTYGTSTSPRIVTYVQVGNVVQRREGYGTIVRDATTKALSWTWALGPTPKAQEMASGVIEVRGIYSITADLTPDDLTELPPADVLSQFRANYTIRYQASKQSKVATQPGTTIANNILIRTQFYGL
jgi:prepilin-type N-terminal cleavage/methylation domain-containing protein